MTLWLALLGIAGAAEVSFADAVREAAQSGPSVRIAEADYRVRAGEALALRGFTDPEIEGESGPDEVAVTVNVTVPLAGQPVAAAAAARSLRDAARVRRDAEVARTALVAGGAYLDLVRAERLAALAEETLALAVRSRDATARLLEAGEIGAVDAVVAASIAARAANDASAARQAALRARRALEVAMGRPPDATVEPTGWPDLPVPPASDADLPDATAAALEARAAASTATLARLSLVPSPEVRAGWGWTDDADGLVVGGAVEVPLFSPGVGSARAAGAEADRAEALAERARLEARAARAGAHSDLAAAEDAYEAARIEGLDSALGQLAAAFDAGEYSLADYVARRDAVLAGSAAAIDARHRLERARLRLWELEGRLPEEIP